MRVSVVVFPGTNCDHDVAHIYQHVLKQNVSTVWHTERDLKNPDLVVLPGGFAHGDYLRTGAMAKVSPIMSEVRSFADRGGPVLGICNGFQILCETGLLPGVLLQNIGMQFLSQFVHLKIENTATPFTRGFGSGAVITCPVGHFEGNYFADAETIERLEKQGQIVFRYCDARGAVQAQDRESNPNGSINSIAGVCNQRGNVVGLMPHPDRAYEAMIGYIGGKSGLGVFESSIAA